jgi:N-methylhydantoinase B/oxoprolinase/acetone carboxylase alpha subunit
MPSSRPIPIVRKNQESSDQRRTALSHSVSRRRDTSAAIANANGIAVAT